MTRTLLAAGASAFALMLAVPAAAEEAESESTAPTMDFGSWGVGTDMIDQDVDPGDDFNAYVNGRWIAENEIPGDRNRYGAFDMLREEAIYDVRRLVNDLVASDPAPGSVRPKSSRFSPVTQGIRYLSICAPSQASSSSVGRAIQECSAWLVRPNSRSMIDIWV